MAVSEFLLLRLEAPLMAFGGPVVDNYGRTRRFPGRAQLTGLLANAMGYRHQDAGAIEALQSRLRFAAAVMRAGELVADYQTVDLGQPHLQGTGWTTRGRPETRAGASGDTTHIRHRWYVADGLVLVAVTLIPAAASPGLAELAQALRYPARPLFIGRKTCLPTAPILMAELRATDAIAALRSARAHVSARDWRWTWPAEVAVEMDATWPLPADIGETESERLVDGRDWANQIHTRERAVHRFSLTLEVETGP